MKIRVTLMTENDKHVDASKEEIERQAKIGWDMVIKMILSASLSRENAYVESVELVEE